MAGDATRAFHALLDLLRDADRTFLDGPRAVTDPVVDSRYHFAPLRGDRAYRIPGVCGTTTRFLSESGETVSIRRPGDVPTGSMRRHEFTIELPHSARRLWALFQRYDLWKEYAPAVLDVEIVWPGDAAGNGLLRRVVYPLPFGRRGESFELVKNVRRDAGYDYVMLRTGLSGSMALEPLGANRTRLRFRETFHMTTPVLRWFEGPIYRYINRKNEESMRGASAWLAAHSEFRPDLID